MLGLPSKTTGYRYLGLKPPMGCATIGEGDGGESSLATAIQIWNPDDWESFSFGLLQARHGPVNVHRIPSAHKGDLGIDFYCTDEGIAYQCYAVEEPIDIVTRADRQKKKITKDLAKLIENAAIVSQLFLGKFVKSWVLLVPLHDSKDVNLHCSKKTVDFRANEHSHLCKGFEVTVQDQSAFPKNVVTQGVSAMSTVTLSVPPATPIEIQKWSAGSKNLLLNAQAKLSKRKGPLDLDDLVSTSISWFLEGNALLEALRLTSPDLHDNILSAIATRTRRLKLAGPQGGFDPGAILSTELENLVAAVKAAAPTLSNDNAEQIALGTVTDWIMRCPLDFPDNAA